MVELAIIGMGMFLVSAGFRSFMKADIVDAGTELSAVLRRTSQLAIEVGEVHRVMIDLDQQNPDAEDRLYSVVQVCHGDASISRNDAKRPDADATTRALEKGQQR